MRFIKRQTTNNKSPIRSKGVVYNSNDEVILDSRRVMLVPKGNTLERPLTPENGHIRYNTDPEEFELFQDNAWRKMRFKEPRSITQQSLGLGDDVETVFGPLDSGDLDYPIPTSAQSVIVLIENVFQLATTNYTLEQSVGGNLTGPNQPYADGWYIKFGSEVPTGKPVTVLHNFDK